MISVIQLKLIDKYEEIINKVQKDIPKSVEGYVDKRINKIESELLNVSNFNELLYEFQDLGISADDPNLSKGLRSVAKDVTKFLKTKGPITYDEIKGYMSTWWEPAAKLVIDKESVNIIKDVGSLLSKANERLQALRDIKNSSSKLSEAELVKKLKSYGLSGNYLEKIKPLERVLRSGWRDIPDPIENYNLLNSAFSSNNPSDKIAVLFSLGSKYGGRVPILGQFIEPLFQVANEMLSATKAIGKKLNENFNQGCIYTDGQYNVQEDPRAATFLKKFPGVEVCPLYFKPSEIKKNRKWTPTSNVVVPQIYKQTYFNVKDENQLYFYINKKWKKAKKSPSHKGKKDIQSIVQWLRSNNMYNQALNAEVVFQIYNNSPGFLEYQKRATQTVAKLKDLLFGNIGIISTLKNGSCNTKEIEIWLNANAGFRNIDLIFPKNDQPSWEDYESKYGRVWSELVLQLQFSEYNKYLKNSNYLFLSNGLRPLVTVEEVIHQLDFSLINIYGKIVGSDGRSAAGIRARFDKPNLLYEGTGNCRKEYADQNGNFNYYYIKQGNSTETRYITARNANDQVIEAKIEIDPAKKKSYYVFLAFPNKCADGFVWNNERKECVAKEGQEVKEEKEQEGPNREEEVVQEEEEEEKGDEPEKEPEDSTIDVPEDYCAAFFNTKPVKNQQTGAIECNCIEGYVWNEKGTGCITKEESLVERADCSLYPHTTAVWSTQDNMVICDCEPGYSWDENQKCIPNDKTAAELADCSGYPNTKPIWSKEDNAIVCDCIEGYEWNSDLTGCEKINQSKNCEESYPNTHAVYNKKDGTYYCECIKGHEWNKDEKFLDKKPVSSLGDWQFRIGTDKNTFTTYPDVIN